MKKIIIKSLFIFTILAMSLHAKSQQLVIDKLLQAGGEKTDIVKDIHFDNEGNLYIVGEFNEKAVFSGKRAKGQAENNIFIAKYSKKTKIRRVTVAGGTGNIYVSSVTSDAENNIYICGDFTKTVNFEAKWPILCMLKSSNLVHMLHL